MGLTIRFTISFTIRFPIGFKWNFQGLRWVLGINEAELPENNKISLRKTYFFGSSEN